MTNWDLIRTQYEILGKDVKELCEVHHVSSDILESAIEQGQWDNHGPIGLDSGGRYVVQRDSKKPAADDKVVGDDIPLSDNGSMAESEEAVEDSELDKLNAEAALLHARHQTGLIPKYIEIETVFLARLKIKAGEFEEASEAKQIADTLAIIKPSIMKQADAKSAKIAEGGLGGRIMVLNQFPVPQPGDENYIAPNAVIVGDAAKQGIDSEFTTVEVDMDMPDIGEMN